MMALAIILAGLWLTLASVPATPIARFLHHWLVSAPARRLNALRNGAVVLALLIVAAIVGIAWLLDLEILRALAMAAPEAATWLTMVEAGTIVDGLIALIVARTALGMASVKTWLASWSPRRTRTSRRKPRPPANDQEDDLRWAA
jgi:hypothetical protein